MKKFKYFLSLLLILTAVWLSKALLIQINAINNVSKDNNWIEFDNSKLKELVNENNIVFVDITADWCLTCFYNKKTVLYFLCASGHIIAGSLDCSKSFEYL